MVLPERQCSPRWVLGTTVDVAVAVPVFLFLFSVIFGNLARMYRSVAHHGFRKRLSPGSVVWRPDLRTFPGSLVRPPGLSPFSSAIVFEAAASNVAVAGSLQPVMTPRANAARWACLDRLRINCVFIASDPQIGVRALEGPAGWFASRDQPGAVPSVCHEAASGVFSKNRS
jgi:hypothetical protein